MVRLALAATVSAFVVSGAAQAATIVIDDQPSPSVGVASINEFTVNGAMMADRLRVTASFASGATETVDWIATSIAGGGAFGGLFSLSLLGDTFTQSWSLTNLGDSLLTSLRLGGAGGTETTIFDKTGGLGTDGSRSGRTFEEAPGVDNGDGEVTVTYLNAVSLPGADPVGDVFANLLLDFSAFADGGLAGSFLFRQDSDIAPLPVPLPAAGLMLVAALAGMGALGRRRATVRA